MKLNKYEYERLIETLTKALNLAKIDLELAKRAREKEQAKIARLSEERKELEGDILAAEAEVKILKGDLEAAQAELETLRAKKGGDK